MRILIIVPAYNEAESIACTLKELRETVPECDAIVVNDSSSDDTSGICRDLGFKVLDLQENLGLAAAMQTGMLYAEQMDYDAAIQIDADGQHDPRFIKDMAAKMEETGADIVIGSRFTEGKRPGSLRSWGNGLLSRVTKLTTGQWISDTTSGMRLYRRGIIKLMAEGINLGPEPDTVAYLIRCGAKVEEVPIKVRERTAGKSYLSPGRSVFYMIHMCMNICFIQWVRKRSDIKCR